MANFDEAIDIILPIEGPYVDHPNDHGGATKYGISLRFLKSIEPDSTKEDIKNLTIDQAKQLYKYHFWNKNRYGEIENQEVATKVFKLAIHRGPHRANKLLQASICDTGYTVDVDGLIGDKTVYALNNSDGSLIGVYFDLQTVDYYRRVVNYDSSQEGFLLGWLNRVFN